MSEATCAGSAEGAGPLGRVAAGTIAAKKYLPYARVLARSWRAWHPETPFYVLLADEIEGCFDPCDEPFELITVDDLAVRHPGRLCFRYAQQPLSYALTPSLLSALLDRGFHGAVFLKQESLVVGDHSPLLALLERHPIVLTPHLLTPLEGPDRADRELNILLSGVFNVGVVGVGASPVARRFLSWWQDRVADHCRHAVGEGMHYEQRWIDLVPAFFEGVHTLRDPGWNVAHWNLPERVVEVEGDRVLVDGQAGRLIRFSGFDPDRPGEVTRYSPRLSMADIGQAAALFARYAEALERAGFERARDWPYAFGRWDNGVAIPDVARELYRELGEGAARFGDPFSAGLPGSFFGWLGEPAAPGRSVTRLWAAIHARRADLRAAFPEPLGADEDAFVAWASSSGAAEHGIEAPLLPTGRVRDP